MTRAIRSVTIERGHDPREFCLAAFGGAGPMHAAMLADTLDIKTVVIPRACGVLSAYGLLAADERHDAVRTYRTSLADSDVNAIEDVYNDLTTEVTADTSDPESAQIKWAADCRYAGQSFELTVPVSDPVDSSTLENRFHTAHETAYGYRMDDTVELVNLRATATVKRDQATVAYAGEGDARSGTRTAVFNDERVEAPVYTREKLAPERDINGSAILEGNESTVVIPPAWDGSVAADGTLICERRGDARTPLGRATAAWMQSNSKSFATGSRGSPMRWERFLLRDRTHRILRSDRIARPHYSIPVEDYSLRPNTSQFI